MSVVATDDIELTAMREKDTLMQEERVAIVRSPRETRKVHPTIWQQIYRQDWAVIRMLIMCALLLALILTCVIIEIATSEYTKLPPEIAKHNKTYHLQLVEEINSKQKQWTAMYNRYAAHGHQMTYDDDDAVMPQPSIDHMARNQEDVHSSEDHLNQLTAKLSTSAKLPDSFDSRLNWPYCHQMHSIVNQGGCGSCWAVALTTVVADRICVASKGTRQPRISAQDLVTCCPTCGDCRGGLLTLDSLRHWRDVGIVSGGKYGSSDGCKPYEFDAKCGVPCAYETYLNAKTTCATECTSNTFSGNYSSDRNRASSIYVLYAHGQQAEFMNVHLNSSLLIWNEQTIMHDMMAHGPVLMCFRMFEDLQHYSKGVYTTIIGSETKPVDSVVYGHCVKMLGWGTDEKSKIAYWLIANSWGEGFGEDGFFRMERTTDKDPLFPILDVAAGIPFM